MAKTNLKTVDEYIALFSGEEQEVLKKIRQTIKNVVPEAEEVISYQMPTFKYYGYLVYFAAFKDHYSLFIPPMGVYEQFKQELASYKVSKATVQFPKSRPVPYDLITRLVTCAAAKNKKQHEEKV